MEMKDIIEKVNFYSKKAKEGTLTKEDEVERQKYRQMYLEKFRAQVRGHLGSIKVVDKDQIN